MHVDTKVWKFRDALWQQADPSHKRIATAVLSLTLVFPQNPVTGMGEPAMSSFK